MSLKVGDRVRAITSIGSRIPEGSEGVVCQSDGRNNPGIRWDHHLNGHDCKNNCTEGHGWYCRPETIELIPPTAFDRLMASIEEAEYVLQDR